MKMVYKQVSTVLMATGIFFIINWIPLLPGMTPYWLLVIGSIIGITKIIKEKGIRSGAIPLGLWGLAVLFIGIQFMDIRLGWSDGLNALGWFIPIGITAMAAVVSTFILMFKSSKYVQ